MSLKKLIALVVGAGAFAAVVGVAMASSTTNGSNAQSQSVKTIVHTCNNANSGSGGGMMGDDGDNDGDTITFSGPTVLWPPNHKYVPVTITATDVDGSMESMMDPGGVTLTTVATSNEPEFGDGSGHTANDTVVVGNGSGDDSASQTVKLRAERDGVDPAKAGRTYTINATATFDGSMMETCHATFTVYVPHDMGQR